MSTIAAIPSPDHGWILASGSRELGHGENFGSVASSRSDVTVGIPSHLVSLFAVMLPPTDESLHESMIFAQAEKRGLTQSAGGGMIDYRVIQRTASGDSFSVSVVGELGDDLIVPSASGYDLYAALRPQPEGGASLWREQGRLVLGLYHEGNLIHLQVLNGSVSLDPSAAQEVSLILMSLAGDPVLGDRLPSQLEVAVKVLPDDDWDSFSQAMTIPVSQGNPEAFVIPKLTARDRLLPNEVTRARKSAKIRSRTLAGLAIAFVVYVVAVSWLWVHSKKTSAEISSLEDQVEILAPDVEQVQLASQRWKALEPAFEKSWFPLVQLNRITSALPGSGVVIREFRSQGRTIRIEGQAKDVQLANRLLEDLQNMAELSRYSWELSNTKVEKNNTANFRIEAKPKNAGPN